ncbi:MAG: GntR family transcriptional regulator [Bacteroidales bacterium]|jgi:DNA-binding FadR family transcriptional regulator|nr:GntR family transcriptional regulator [Bacteroidales bacterium]
MDNQDLKIDLIPAEYSTLADRVEMKLIEVFQGSKLKPGDPIPKEKDLAVMMGVSRTVIREALVRLKTMGLLAAKKHKGTVISSPDISAILRKSIIPEILDRHTLMDLFEMRLALEVGMADFIFSRKTEADIEQLEDIVDIEPVHSASMVFNVDQEIRFHGKLYEMSGNPTLMSFQNLVLPVFQLVYNTRFFRKGKRIKYKTHKELVFLLKNGTQDEFREGMKKHLEDHFERIIRKDYIQ